MKRFLLLFLIGLNVGTAGAETLPTLTLSFASNRMVLLRVEVASSPAEKAQGLMWRELLERDEGMVFVNDKPQALCMWMKNTLIPLDVAFVNAQGKITQIQAMKPKTETHHCAPNDTLYAIETNQGWFASRLIKVGDTVVGLPR